MPNLTPADLADLDQAHAAGNADLDEMVREQRTEVAQLGTTLAAAILTAQLQTSDFEYDDLAGMAALAITRLATQTADAAPVVAVAPQIWPGADDDMGGGSAAPTDGRTGG